MHDDGVFGLMIPFAHQSSRIVRWRDLQITPEALQGMLTKGWRGDIECMQGLPDDAKFIYSYITYMPTIIHLVFEADSFDEIEQDHRLPSVLASFRVYYHEVSDA